MANEIDSRIQALRDQMRQAGVDAAIFPQTDPHQGEYLASHWQVRRWLSGFTGSAGDLVVTMDKAYVWADSRYWLQSTNQLKGTSIGVMYEGKPETPTITDYLCSELKPGQTVGVDGMVFNVAKTEEMEKEFARHGIRLRVDFNPIDLLWLDRPELPKDKVFVHDLKFAGESVGSKLERVLENVKAQDADAAFISDLAEIAWILNIRSNDVLYNPVVTAFLYIAPKGSRIFVDADKLTDDVRRHLEENGVAIDGYDRFGAFLAQLPADERVLINPAQTAIGVKAILGDRAVGGNSPILMPKAIKNETQIEGIRRSMVRDGVALVKTYMELEDRLAKGIPTTEIDADKISEKYRSENPEYFELSFGSISGFGPHGAIVHYEADEESNSTLEPNNLWLFDSGVNYVDGTTDITRTVTLGEPTNAQRHDFTLVMKGHIAIAQSIFPVGTTGHQLDAMARMPLWKEGMSYLHGTGHGVGHFLNVHEGPQSIRLNDTHAPLTPGMITSNEPGLYREGEYGIRCENLVLTVPAFTTDFGEFLKFETLTLFPFDIRLFDTAIMSDDEIRWVNDYHAMVCERLLPHLNAEQQQWLIAKTRKLEKPTA